MSLTAVLLVVISAFIHAGWNMLVKSRQASAGFLMAAMMVGALCTLPVLGYYAEILPRIPQQLWLLLIATGIAQTFYNMALGAAYRNGDLSVAYPIARSMPVLMVGTFTLLVSGPEALSQAALAGMLLIVAGTFLLPVTRLQHWHIGQYLNIGCLFAVLAAVGTTGYSVIDSRAMQQLQQQLLLSTTESSLLYISLMSLFAALCFLATLTVSSSGRAQIAALRTTPKSPIILVGIGTTLTYGLVLAAMLHVDDVSYVVAFRQLSIPVGVLLGLLILKEQVSPVRLTGVMVMFCGLVLVALG